MNDLPGAPRLPLWSTVVELPPSGGWRIEHQSTGAAVLARRVDVPAVPVPDVRAFERTDLNGNPILPVDAPTVYLPDPSIYGVNAFYPESPIVVGAEQWQRGRHLLSLRVFPFQYNPVTRQLRYHPDLEVIIHPTPEEPSSVQTGVPAGFEKVINAPASTPGALRIRTAGRGMVRLTYDDLLAAGVPLATVAPATFALNYLGQPVASEVTGAEDGRFDPGDLVVFYAQPYVGRYQRDNVYWFTYGGALGLRMATRTVTPTGNEPVVTTITQTLHVEFDREYRTLFPRPQDADHWFDTPLSPDSATTVLTATRTYDLALDDALANGTVRLRAALHGGVDRPVNPDKSIAIYLNNHWVAAHRWEGMTYNVSTDSLPASWLDGALNQVHLVAAISQLPGIDFYSVSPDWVEVTYPALADAEDDSIYVEGMTAGASQVAVSGFSTSAVQVYDLRNPNQPVRLLTTRADPSGAAYTISFWDANLPGPTYFLSSYAALVAPLAIEPDIPSSWGIPNHEADYIAIVHSSLWNAVDPLLAYRTAQGLRVTKVDVQDIYDEWSYGRRDPEAIRSFLSYAYHCWNDADCVPDPGGAPDPPQYVLLVGDGHYDFTGVSGTTFPNLIPPYLAHVDPWMGETLAENRFVSVDGPNDFLPDMSIGRIPANTPFDVESVVAKIIAYETAAPSGQWQERVVFVADKDVDPAGNFHALSDNVRLQWLPSGYDDRTIYYNRDYFTGPEMRAAVKSAFNDDALLIQWFGHSSRYTWGSFVALNYNDPPTFNPNDTWPITAHYTCYTGYFGNLSYGIHALGETLVRTAQRGSVADFSSSGANLGSSLLVLDQGLTSAIFSGRIEPVGKSVDAAKEYYFQHGAGMFNVIDTFILFGDPALRLKLPTASLETSTASVTAAQAVPGESLHYTVTVQNTGSFTLPQVVVTADYAETHGQVSADNPPATNVDGVLRWTIPELAPGATSLTFDLDLDEVQPAGTTEIHAPIAVQAYGVTWAELDPISTLTAAPQLSTSSLNASRNWVPPAFPLTYTFTLSNTGNALSAATWLTATLPTDLISVTSPSLVYNSPAHRLTWQGPVPVATPVTLSFTAVVSPTRSACGHLTVSANLRDQLGQETPMMSMVHLAVPDVDCEGDVDVVDVQAVAARWGEAAGSAAYDPRYDLDGDGTIAVQDVIIAAEQWN